MEYNLDKVYDEDSYEYEKVRDWCWMQVDESPLKCEACGGVAIIYPASFEKYPGAVLHTPKRMVCVELQVLEDGFVDDNAGVNGHGCGWQKDLPSKEE